MKIVETKTETVKKAYVCEVCNKEFRFDFYAKECELRHTCKHEFSISQGTAANNEVRFLIEKCKLCGTSIGRIDLYYLPDQAYVNIYDLVKTKHPRFIEETK